MFNLIFPIFCFGLVITGIVYLGLLEAVKQVEDEASKNSTRDAPLGEKIPSPLTAPRS
jgi:hypothetical protein